MLSAKEDMDLNNMDLPSIDYGITVYGLRALNHKKIRQEIMDDEKEPDEVNSLDYDSEGSESELKTESRDSCCKE